MHYINVTSSKYEENSISITHRDKHVILWKYVYENNEADMPDQDKFDPVDFGHEISKIQVNKEILF